MRIHTSLSEAHIVAAATAAGVQLERAAAYGSRTHPRAFDVKLSGSGVTGGQWGNSGTDGAAPVKAATWDEWGIFLAALFAEDSATRTRDYNDAADFHYQTGDRFRTLKPAGQHKRHKWEFVTFVDRAAYPRTRAVHGCGCGATTRNDHLTDALAREADRVAREGGNVFEGCPGYEPTYHSPNRAP